MVSQMQGWVNLHPDQVVVDSDILILTISKSARDESLVVFPSKAAAMRARHPEQVTHPVYAELPDGTIFEVVGRMGEVGDSFPYRVGLFADYDDAFRIASAVNINGSRGSVRLIFDYEPVHRSVAEYQAHKRRARYTDQAYYLHSVVEISDDPSLRKVREDGSSSGRS